METPLYPPNVMPENYYILNIYLTDTVSKDISEKYKTLSSSHNTQFNQNNSYIDAGIDLYCVSNQSIKNNSFSNMVDLGIKCSMSFISTNNLTQKTMKVPCGYFLYPRSSTGSKTPLRLSNSVGVMDAGYRGNVIACFDNIDNTVRNFTGYNIEPGIRLVQICSPNITYPTLINIVPTISDLDIHPINLRGMNGFGSSGS